MRSVIRSSGLWPLLMAAAGLFAWAAVAQPGVSIGTVSAPNPGVVAVPVSLTSHGATASTLVLRVGFDPTLLQADEVALESPIIELGKSIGYLVKDNVLNAVVYGGAQPLPDGLLFRLVFNVVGGSQGQQIPVIAVGADAATPEAQPLAVQVTPGAVQIAAQTGFHTADLSHDWNVSLSELLRVIQFFNMRAFHCESGTEDGYAPLAGDQSCAPHRSDYAPLDWSINLSELLRLIQFFNSPGSAYHPNVTGEDGYFPGPF